MTPRPTIIVVDDFLADPDVYRGLALAQKFVKDGSAGQRSVQSFASLMKPERFEKLLGRRITDWNRYPISGKFQICTAQDPIVFHSDTQEWAATIFLTPNAPPESGLSLVKNRRGEPPQESNFYDATQWETVDRVGNVYNRLVIWDARHPHAPSAYFGNGYEDGRLFWVWFFDTEGSNACLVE